MEPARPANQANEARNCANDINIPALNASIVGARWAVVTGRGQARTTGRMRVVCKQGRLVLVVVSAGLASLTNGSTHPPRESLKAAVVQTEAR